jgi:hypothetical protein
MSKMWRMMAVVAGLVAMTVAGIEGTGHQTSLAGIQGTGHSYTVDGIQGTGNPR